MISPVIKQTWLMFSILINMVGTGMQLGFTSGLLAGLAAPDSTIRLSMETSSWLVAIFSPACMLGFLFTAFMMDRLGRRLTFGIEILPAFAGLFLTYYATDATFLIWGRVLTGISAGGTFTMGAVSIGEYCSPKYRSMFLNMKTASSYVGSLIVHILGYYYHWRTVALLILIPCVGSLLITCTWPESPSWLAQRGRFTESEEVFYRLRGTTEDSVREIEELIRTQKDAKRKNIRTFLQKIVYKIKRFTKRNFLKPMLIFLFAAILLESSGRHFFPAYANQIITKITDNNSHAFYYNVALDVILSASALFSSYLIKRMELRRLLFSTGLVSCVLLALACSYLYLAAKDFIPKGYAAIPISLFGMYLIFVNLGCATIPLSLMGEIFPLEHRAIGSSIAGYLINICTTLSFKLMPLLLYNFEFYGSFAIFGVCTALTLLVLYFILPETKNRTLQEIEDYFSNGRFREASEVRAKEDVEFRMICKGEEYVDNI